MRPCDTVAKHYHIARPTEVSKCLKEAQRKRACGDEFFAKVTEGVVHVVYKVLTRSSFDVTR